MFNFRLLIIIKKLFYDSGIQQQANPPGLSALNSGQQDCYRCTTPLFQYSFDWAFIDLFQNIHMYNAIHSYAFNIYCNMPWYVNPCRHVKYCLCSFLIAFSLDHFLYKWKLWKHSLKYKVHKCSFLLIPATNVTRVL
jgi:hypothetical protein